MCEFHPVKKKKALRFLAAGPRGGGGRANRIGGTCGGGGRANRIGGTADDGAEVGVDHASAGPGIESLQWAGKPGMNMSVVNLSGLEPSY